MIEGVPTMVGRKCELRRLVRVVEGVPTMVGRKCEYGKLYQVLIKKLRRLVRVVEGARLESVYTSKGYRGFESLSLRWKAFFSNFN